MLGVRHYRFEFIDGARKPGGQAVGQQVRKVSLRDVRYP